MQSLFTVPERSEEATKRNNADRVVRRSKAFGEVVAEPLKDTDITFTTVVEMLKVPKDGKEFYLCFSYCDRIVTLLAA